MDTQNTSNPVSWLSLVKKHFKPKTIEVMVATPPLMQSTSRYLHVHCHVCTKHVIEVIQYVRAQSNRNRNIFLATEVGVYFVIPCQFVVKEKA